MILLSYSTIKDIIDEPHTWLCKQMGLKKVEFDYYAEGKAAHRVWQDHLAGIKEDRRLNDIQARFPLVELVEKDPHMEVFFKYNSKYSVHGFLDARDNEQMRFGEIKSSIRPWGLGQFYALKQWKVYALTDNWKTVQFFTSTRVVTHAAAYSPLAITDLHRAEGLAFVKRGIDILENEDLTARRQPRRCGYIGCPYCQTI